MRISIFLAALCCVAAAVAIPVGAANPSRADAVSTPVLLADANQAFRDHRYAAAYGRFARLADTGHVASAQAALFMLRNGQALFGSDWSASEEQQMLWQALVVNGARARVELVPNPAGD